MAVIVNLFGGVARFDWDPVDLFKPHFQHLVARVLR